MKDTIKSVTQIKPEDYSNSNNNLYERYTTTSSLPGMVNQEIMLAWTLGYFHAHYSSLLPSDKNAKILEVGCGYGRYLAALSEMGYKNSYGIDISSEQVEYARTVLRLTNVEQTDALEWLDGKDAMFDCVLGLDILEHFQTDDLLELVRKMHKVLKPGGTVIFQVPNGMSPLNPIIYGDLTHVRAFTPQSMRQLFLHIGFLPLGYFEIPPHIHGIKSAIQKVLWVALVKPVINALVRVMHGKVIGGSIYSANFIAYAKKDSDMDELKSNEK
jgi:2-polyprenyl-3-methyl-5-hydroxy-6-metoxy-1,4-benzoquinol methylase